MGKVFRLLLLGLGQVATVAAAVLAGQFVVLESSPAGGRDGVILGVLFGAAGAALLITPLLGAVAQLPSLQAALRWGSVYLVVVTLPFLLIQDYWLLWWLLLSFGLAWVLPLRSALVLTAARELEVSATRLWTLGIFYSLAAAFAGWVLGYVLWRLEGPGLPLPLGYSLALLCVGLASTLAAPFAGDERQPTGTAPSWGSRFRLLWSVRTFRWTWVVGSLTRGGAIALVCWLALTSGSEGEVEGLSRLTFFLFGAALASLITALEPHPRRILGFLPLGFTALTGFLLLMALREDPYASLTLLGWGVGFLLGPLQNGLFVELYEDELLAAEILRRAGDYVCAGFWGLVLVAASAWAGLAAWHLLLGFALLAGLVAVFAWRRHRREAAEMVVEWLVAVFYRVSATGPGMRKFPRRGPVLVICNHACWFDPLFLGYLAPRKIIPMMTSLFFDLPMVRWAVKGLGEAIRVEAVRFRRDVPELREAVAVLDRGETLVVFPEGAMRKNEEQWLRRFGQGVMHILRERPETPIIACWIEGNWGSFTSYYNGLPTKNKKMDFRREIRVGVAEPFRIDPELLEDRWAAREHLRHAVMKARGLLGLEVPALDQQPAEVEAEA